MHTPHPDAHILCIDYSDSMMEIAIRQEVLKTAGYEVLVATSTYEALNTLLKNRVDLVLMEQGLSAAIGAPPLAATLKRMRPRLPVVIYSGDWEESTEETRFANAFVSKLVPPDELLGKIDDLLTRKPGLQTESSANTSWPTDLYT